MDITKLIIGRVWNKIWEEVEKFEKKLTVVGYGGRGRGGGGEDYTVLESMCFKLLVTSCNDFFVVIFF